MEVKIQVFFYVIVVLVVAMFWMKIVEVLGWGLTYIILFMEEKFEKMKNIFWPPVPEKKDRPLQAGDICPKCEDGHLEMEFSPFHPQMSGETYAPVELWPFELKCPFCGEVIQGRY